MMPTFFKKLPFLASLLFVPFLLSGCFPTATSGGAGEQTQEYVKGKVVDGFPNVPGYPKATTIESYGYGGSWGASFVSEDPADKVVAFYDASLTSLGWDSTLNETMSGYFKFDVKNSENKGEVIVNTASDGKMTAITISLESR